MKRAVILKHTLPGGSWHFDWLLQTTDDPESRLLTFRSGHHRPDRVGSFDADRLPDHRAIYLDYEGPISEGRGEVARISTGEICEFALSDESCSAVIVYPGNRLRFEGELLAGDRWRFVVSPR